MEPTNNSNANFNTNNSSSSTAPGTQFGSSLARTEPLTETPRVTFTPMTDNKPAGTPVGATAQTSSMTHTSAPHSALDRLMNPTLNTSSSAPAHTPSTSPSSTSAFKPYVPPAGYTPSASQSNGLGLEQKATLATTASSVQKTEPASRLGYTVGAPLSSNPVPQRTSPLTSSSSFSGSMESKDSQSTVQSSVFGVPPAPSVSATSKALNQEIHSILNNQSQVVPKKSHATVVYSLIGLILLGGIGYGTYYWYTGMYSGNGISALSSRDENKARVENRDQQSTASANKNTSVFPTSVTNKVPTQAQTSTTTLAKPNSNTFASTSVTVSKQATKPVSTQPKSTTKASLVTTPFNTEQRRIVSVYISTNINKIAPVASRSSYSVENVTFDGPQRAIVQYSDAKGVYSAVATASLDTSGTIKITSFIPLEK